MGKKLLQTVMALSACACIILLYYKFPMKMPIYFNQKITSRIPIFGGSNILIPASREYILFYEYEKCNIQLA